MVLTMFLASQTSPGWPTKATLVQDIYHHALSTLEIKDMHLLAPLFLQWQQLMTFPDLEVQVSFTTLYVPLSFICHLYYTSFICQGTCYVARDEPILVPVLVSMHARPAGLRRLVDGRVNSQS